MTEKEISDIERVKRLLILLLLKLGATSEEIGVALGIDSSGVRKIFPVRSIKKIELIR